jgi:hypothetical protein
VAKFTDAAGREWKLNITAGDLAPLLDVGFDIDMVAGAYVFEDEAFHDQVMRMAIGSPKKRAEALWVLCEKQAEKEGVSKDAFLCAFDGSTNKTATRALFEAIANFSPDGLFSQAIQANGIESVIPAIRPATSPSDDSVSNSPACAG